MANIVSIITKCFISLYWVVLIGFNIRNFINMPKEAKSRNRWIYALIIVNALVIFWTFICIFV